MAQSDAQERTEEATPRRRQKARRKGTVAKSVDLNGSVVTLGLLLVLPAAFTAIGLGFLQALKITYRNVPTTLDFATLESTVIAAVKAPLLGVAMLAATAMFVGLATNFAQVGFVLSAEPLNPQLNRINPLNGMKRLFSRRSVFEAFKASFKTGLFALVAWTAIQAHWNDLLSLSSLTPAASITVAGALMKTLALRIAIVWLALAAADFFFQRKQVNKELMMSKEDLRQEMKETETSPELKSAIAMRRRRLSKGRMMQAIPTADVVITNPTHYAVAIKYDQGKDAAPRVVAKGADLLAARIRELAAQHRVPIVPNPPLARTLYRKCEIGESIPRDLFQPVAEVLAYVYRTIKKVRGE